MGCELVSMAYCKYSWVNLRIIEYVLVFMGACTYPWVSVSIHGLCWYLWTGVTFYCLVSYADHVNVSI
jgi:hypothetical protein